MRIHGASMLPALRPGDVILVDESAYRRRPPRHGELVAARPAGLDGRALVKRVVGLPHERIERQGRSWLLGAEEYFLAGDAPDDSLDSRTLGPILRDELIGRVWFRLWPPTRLRAYAPGAAR